MVPPQEYARRHVRYPLHLPVSLWLGEREIRTRSENISLHGLLVSCSSLIPEGAAVQLAVAVGGGATVYLTARGKVLRVRLKDSGDFAVAIECESPLGFARAEEAPDPSQLH